MTDAAQTITLNDAQVKAIERAREARRAELLREIEQLSNEQPTPAFMLGHGHVFMNGRGVLTKAGNFYSLSLRHPFSKPFADGFMSNRENLFTYFVYFGGTVEGLLKFLDDWDAFIDLRKRGENVRLPRWPM